ncbi:MAG TPA: serine/threonine-protein kinase [Phycisphaerae bacterium]|nr:serine/threonine-protein kinase [Phycisphaerae bacterium]
MKAADHRLFDEAGEPAPSEAGGAPSGMLVEAVREYMAALEAGLRPSRREFAARYPEIADELAPCLDGLAFVNSAAAQLHEEPREPPPLAPPATAQPLGDFRLIREIGRGGMGIVYEAIQLSLGRRVAVKVLPFTAALDPRHLQRFRNEAQAAAQLHHSNIVPVYAVGSDRSVHYYAMQLIEGQSVAAIIRAMRMARGISGATDRHSASTGDRPDVETVTRLLDAAARLDPPTQAAEEALEPAEAFPIALQVRSAEPAASLSQLHTGSRSTFYRTAARLGQQAAEALDYAHAAGVVHRDIKPANLLVDVRGNLWITDFGLAQMFRENELTQTGDLLGTLAYMSPEQASGKAVVLDERTDIYSLGVTLYELLTLRRALHGEGREALLHQLSASDPPAMRSIDRRIPRELEVIVQKACAKDPSERYQTARALADDLARFLRDEPILAKPPTRWDRLVKWTRRHRSLAIGGLLLLAVMTVGLLTTTVLIARAQRRTNAAYELEQQRTYEAAVQRARAHGNFLEARKAVDTFATIAEQELTDDPVSLSARRELLETALSYYQTFLKDQADNAGDAANLAAAQEQVSAILDELTAGEEFSRVLSRVSLLSDHAIWRELALTDSQTQRCVALQAEITGQVSDIRRLTPRERRDRYDMLAETADATLADILNPAQYTRLHQLARQLRGPYAFTDPEIVTRLALTPEQKVEIRDIIEAMHDSRMANPPPTDRPEPPAAREAAYARAVTKILDLLSTDQRAAWTALTGEPYHPRRFGPPGRGGPGGPDGPGPGAHRGPPPGFNAAP